MNSRVLYTLGQLYLQLTLESKETLCLTYHPESTVEELCIMTAFLGSHKNSEL